jgi:hypothetical protein
MEISEVGQMEFGMSALGRYALQDSLGTAITSVLANKQKPQDALRDAEKSYNAARE